LSNAPEQFELDQADDEYEEDGTIVPNSGVKLSQPSTGMMLCNRYLLEEQIGKGSAAVVHRGVDTQLKLPVAIKILKTGSLNTETAAAGLGISLRNEAVAAMRLSHPNILRVINYEACEQWEFLVMEYVEGEDIRKLRRQSPEGCLPIGPTVRVGIQCLRGLQYAHGLDVVHHDIKPSNILLTSQGEVKLADFGLARLSTTRWRRGVVAGTPGFLSPERLVGEPGDHRSDLFSMGATLYALANGVAPYGTDPLRVHKALTAGRLPDPGHLPEPIFRVIARSLAQRPEDRFADAREMRVALTRAGEAANVPMPKETGLSYATVPPAQVPAPAHSAAVRSAAMPPPPPPRGPQADPALVSEASFLDLDVSFDSEAPAPPPPPPPVPGGLAQSSGLYGNRPTVQPPSAPMAPAVPPRVIPEPVRQEPRRVEARAPREPAPTAPKGMVIIPAWTFRSNFSGREGQVRAFAMDILPVTNADYARFAEDEAHTPPQHWNGWEPPEDRHDHPVVGVTLEDARAYADWAGKRLPTGIEWESACRNGDARAFPWGDDWDPTMCHCREGGASDTCEVGTYPQGASPAGCLDLLGNVWEWAELVPNDAPEDPELAWVYGGSYRHRSHQRGEIARNPVSTGNDYDYLGFRCAMAVGR